MVRILRVGDDLLLCLLSVCLYTQTAGPNTVVVGFATHSVPPTLPDRTVLLETIAVHSETQPVPLCKECYHSSTYSTCANALPDIF